MATKKEKSELMEDEYGPVTAVLKGVLDSKNPFTSLGKEIKISPKSKVNILVPGAIFQFYVESVEVLIGIGNDHTAHLVMDMAAFEALKAGAKIEITTLKNFKGKLK